MKNALYLIAFLIGITSVKAQTQTTFVVSTNGIAPIPAFNLGRPAILAFVKTPIVSRLTFEPDFAFDLTNGKGWFADTWIRWYQPLDSSEKWVATVGFDWSLFFQPFQLAPPSVPITQTVHYPTYQARLKFEPNKKHSVVADYWFTHPMEKEYGVMGSYASLCYTRTITKKTFSFVGKANAFFIGYSDGTKGFAASEDISVVHSKTGLFLNAQFLHTITANNVSPNWALAIGIERNSK